MFIGCGALIGSLHPVQIRSTATNTIFNFGRAIGGFSPILVGYILQSYDMKVAMLYLAALYSISFIVMMMLKNRKKTEDKLKNKGWE
jgi:dipeptide/tripeptide permease